MWTKQASRPSSASNSEKNPQKVCICGFFYLPLHPINQISNKIMDDYPADNYDL